MHHPDIRPDKLRRWIKSTCLLQSMCTLPLATVVSARGQRKSATPGRKLSWPVSETVLAPEMSEGPSDSCLRRGVLSWRTVLADTPCVPHDDHIFVRHCNHVRASRESAIIAMLCRIPHTFSAPFLTLEHALTLFRDMEALRAQGSGSEICRMLHSQLKCS